MLQRGKAELPPSRSALGQAIKQCFLGHKAYFHSRAKNLSGTSWAKGKEDQTSISLCIQEEWLGEVPRRPGRSLGAI